MELVAVLNTLEHHYAGIGQNLEIATVHQLRYQREKQALGHRVIVGIY